MEENPIPPDSPGPAESASERPRHSLQVGSPDALLAVIPSLLGFHPGRSLVVVGAAPPRGRIELAFRYDLPDPPDARAAAKVAAHASSTLTRQELPLAVAAGYGPGPLVTPVADALLVRVRRAGIALQDMLRVYDGRYWSYLCDNPRCCPPEGVLYDPASHPAAVALAAAGSRVVRDRAALAATIAPLGGLAGESMREAVRRAERRAAALIQAGQAGRGDDGARRVIAEGLRAVAEAIGVYRQGGRIAGDDRIAWLAVVLADLRVRDDAWVRMEPGHREAHLRLWTDVVRRAPARYVPAPASLLAFTAWQSGNGALANVALERALAADPGYSMALLLQDALSAGIPPSAARMPMTPGEVAASYEQPRPPGSSHGRSGGPPPGSGDSAGPASVSGDLAGGPGGSLDGPGGLSGGSRGASGGSRSPGESGGPAARRRPLGGPAARAVPGEPALSGPAGGPPGQEPPSRVAER